MLKKIACNLMPRSSLALKIALMKSINKIVTQQKARVEAKKGPGYSTDSSE
jgi:hypothetical protein